MNSKVETYIRDQLAFSGFAIASANIAYRLRGGDLWQTRIEVGFDFTEAIPKLRQFLNSLPLVSMLEVQLESADDWAIVAFRSQNGLMDRIEQITGERVKAVRPVAEPTPEPLKATVTDPNPIPDWPCLERTERLRAAGIEDTMFKQPQRFAPPTARKARSPA